MDNCNSYIVVPELETDICNGCRTNSKCVYSTDAYTLLNLPANTSLDVILNALVLAYNAQKTLIENLEQRIETLEN
jgi:hypothetical protein